MTTIELRDQDDIESQSDSDVEADEAALAKRRQDYTVQLIKACQKGDFTIVKKCISKGANIFYEDNKKKWCPLLWASCKGYLDIVRYLIQQGAAEPFTTTSDQPRHVIQGTINSNLKPTPLQWACFKGQIQIVHLLLKNNLRWDDIDSFGNDCVHQAAASGNIDVFQILLAFGVSCDRLNTRQHSCSDLSTSTAINSLITLHQSIKSCHICKNPPRIKHWCIYCKNFVCENCRQKNWVYENKDSQEPEKLDIRCNNCYAIQEKHEIQLRAFIDRYQYESICQKIEEIQAQDILIDVKLKEHASIIQERLKNQLQIKNYINKLQVIEDYKTILKSVKILQEMKDYALDNNVALDQEILDLILQQQGRLVAERNLRYELDNIQTNNATQEQVDRLCSLMQQAKDNKVAQNYIDDAEILRSKMFKGIQSTSFFKDFCEYPTRWIPDPIMYDPKTKKPIDPVTKKPIDPKNLPKPPKPKKGDAKFVIPAWAETTDKHQEAINQFTELLNEAENLNLTDYFVNESKTQIARLKNDLRYRFQLEKEAKDLAELKAAEKAKKKKK